MKNLLLKLKGTPIVVACPVMKNNDNISMMARSASCFGVKTFITTGQNKVDSHISRNCSIDIQSHRSLLPVIKKYKEGGYRILGIEQTKDSIPLSSYCFLNTPTLLVVGNECSGMSQEVLNELNDTIEIPLAGEPYSMNVAAALSICLYERSKQFGEVIK